MFEFHSFYYLLFQDLAEQLDKLSVEKDEIMSNLRAVQKTKKVQYEECDQICESLVATHVPVMTEAVRSSFARLSPHKAPGPEGIRGRVLRECASQLARLFEFLYTKWKLSTVIPVPKKANGKEMNDFRPVALTSILSKCMERVVCNQLVASVADRMDPLQFSYKAKRGVEDACLVLLNTIGIVSHLDIAGSYVRVLFMDLSSAFNTIQPHLLLKRLLDLDTSHTLVLWIRQFLQCNRPQWVSLNGVMSV